MKVDNGLKQLQTKKRTINEEIDVIKTELSINNKKLSQKQKELSEVNEKIKSLSKEDIVISEHAIYRYCERVLEIDIGEIKKILITDKMRTMMETIGTNGTFPNENGFSVVIKNNIVVTVQN